MTLLMTTICPERLFFMSGITSLIMRTTPKKLVSNTCFISSMLMLSTGPSKPTPALLTDREQSCYHLQLWSWDQLRVLPLGVSMGQPQEGWVKTLDDNDDDERSGSGVISLVQQGFLSQHWDNCSHLGSHCLKSSRRNHAGLMTPALGD